MQLHYPLNPTTGVEDPTQLPWQNGVPSTGQEGSYPPFQAVVDPMQELVNLITLAGLTPSDGDMDQVTRAVRGGQLDFDATDTGTADAVLCQVGLAHTAIAAGLPFTFIKGSSPNTGNAVPTLTITDLSGNNGLTGTIVKSGGGALAKGDLPAGALITVRARAPNVFAVVSLLTISDILALIAANGGIIRVTDTGGISTSDSLLGTTVPPISAYATGQIFQFTQVVSGANTTTAPKANLTSGSGATLGQLTFTRRDASALAVGDFPPGADFLAQLDASGHLRILGMVPSDILVAVQPGKHLFFTASGTNAYTGALSPAPNALTPNMQVWGYFNNANTSAASPTLTLNGIGPYPITTHIGNTPAPGDIVGYLPFVLNGNGNGWIIGCPVPSDIKVAAYVPTVVVYTSGSGTYTVPPGVYVLQYELVGAGAGGSYAGQYSAGAGGNAGDVVTGTLAVVPGQTYAWVVGALGTGGNSGTYAQPGGNTTFGSLAAAGGGAQANVGSNTVASAPSATGFASVGQFIVTGQQAEAGFITGTGTGQQQWGGHGGNCPVGFGGNGARNGGTVGNVASGVGGGGGAGSNTSTGGNGGSGRITLRS